MSAENILLNSNVRLASERRTRDSVEEDFQRVTESHVGELPIPFADYFASSAPSDEMAAAAASYSIAPASAEVLRVHSIAILISTASAPEMTDFGDIAALTTGCLLQLLDTADAEIVDLLGGQPLKSNNDLATVGAVTIHEQAASYTLRCLIDFPVPVRVDGGASEKLRITTQDSLSGLTRMRAMARGLREDTQS